MSKGEPEFTGTVRLSDAIARLCAAGVGEVDVLRMIAKAALRTRLVATGFQSVQTGKGCHDSADRMPIRRLTWWAFCSPRADATGFVRGIIAEDIIWSRGEGASFMQEAWSAVLLDRPSFDLWLLEIAENYRPRKMPPADTEAWIRAWPGRNSKTAWEEYRKAHGRRACQRDEEFQPTWLRIHENPRPGQPKKSPKASPA